MTARYAANIPSLSKAINRRLEHADRELVALISASPVLYVFGSRAAGVNGPRADVDLLIVSEAPFHWRSNGLDVVSVTLEQLQNRAWLHSELATHIAEYGMAIKSGGYPLSNTRPDRLAVLYKQKRLNAYLRALAPKWNGFDAVTRKKYTTKIYLDLTRLTFLEKGMAVPPTALLEGAGTFLGSQIKEVGKNVDLAFLGNLSAAIENFSQAQMIQSVQISKAF